MYPLNNKNKCTAIMFNNLWGLDPTANKISAYICKQGKKKTFQMAHLIEIYIYIKRLLV